MELELKLRRRYKGAAYTIGDLYVNGVKLCETLEDTDRGLDSTMTEERIREIKVYGKTAIPRGEYHVQMGVESPKFKSKIWAKKWGGRLPRILSVKGFEGCLIHVGNYPEDTDGCVLVGENKVKGGVVNSTSRFDELMEILVHAWYAGTDIVLRIE